MPDPEDTAVEAEASSAADETALPPEAADAAPVPDVVKEEAAVPDQNIPAAAEESPSLPAEVPVAEQPPVPAKAPAMAAVPPAAAIKSATVPPAALPEKKGKVETPPLAELEVELNFVLGRQRIPLTEVRELTEGKVFSLGGSDFQATIFLQEKAVAQAQLMMVDGVPALQVTKILVS